LDLDSLEYLERHYNLQDINLDIQVGNSKNSDKYNINCCIREDSRSRMLGYVFIGRPIGELMRAHENLKQTHTQLKKSQDRLVESEKMASLGRLVFSIKGSYPYLILRKSAIYYGRIHSLSLLTIVVYNDMYVL